MKHIIISGGNFINKGAEAMLYVAVSACLTRWGTCDCCLQLPGGFVHVTSLEELYALSRGDYASAAHSDNGHPGTHRGNGYSGRCSKLRAMLREYRRAELLLDISGFELSSQLGTYPSLRYLFRIRLCRWTRTRVILMPQSFGPFTYPGRWGRLLPALIRRIMAIPEICHAREEKSAAALREAAPKARIRRSPDMVLCDRSVMETLRPLMEADESYRHALELPERMFPQSGMKSGFAGLVVNRRLYEQYSREGVNAVYTCIIQALRAGGRRVLLLCHAKDDLAICRELAASFPGDDGVAAAKEVLSCCEFQLLAGRLDYVVAARYHAIVHAFKAGTPCIALGWSEKYRELMRLMGQEAYLVPVGAMISEEVPVEELPRMIRRMEERREQEKAVIADRLKELQNDAGGDTWGL